MNRRILVSVPFVLGSILFLGALLGRPPFATPAAGKPAAPVKPPFEITEKRDRCSNYTPNRQALFGVTHLHTGLSFDASIYDVDSSRNNPAAAYRFAQAKGSIQLPLPSGVQADSASITGGPSRAPKIDHAIDWGAVTDHSEHFGLMGICKDEFLKGKNVPERLSLECRMLNNFFYEPGRAFTQSYGKTVAGSAFTQLTVSSDAAISHNTHMPVCENNPQLCRDAEWEVWASMQKAAEDAYDRTAACSFTSFIAYENSSSPLGNTWHRNVIFRNDRVVRSPVNAIDMAVIANPDPTKTPINTIGGVVIRPEDAKRIAPAPPGVYDHPLPQPFWNKLENDCTKGNSMTGGRDNYCDFITIPHNTNLSSGNGLVPPSFLDPYNTEDAKRHQAMEPLVEIYQIKGSSECRYDPRCPGPHCPFQNTTTDEQCAFEILDSRSGSNVPVSQDGDGVADPASWPRRSWVRDIWEDGIQYAAGGKFEGVNPFKMGVVASSDAHTGVMGWHPESDQWPGHNGVKDAWPVSAPESIQSSTGGFSVVWAEENSRDAIFSAMKRKETYGTSGTRITVRFFGGWGFPDSACKKDFVTMGYQQGVPMGGDLPAHDGGSAPTFIIAAWSDQYLKTNLQQIQIIKASVDSKGQIHEEVVTVAGDANEPPVSQIIDKNTCRPQSQYGKASFCAVWKDHSFKAGEHAFYYARVLEEPVCRYSTQWCRTWVGVDPLLGATACQKQLDGLKSGGIDQKTKAKHGAMCCSDTTTDTFVQPIIQERAWTSPIWYEPPAGTAKAK